MVTKLQNDISSISNGSYKIIFIEHFIHVLKNNTHNDYTYFFMNLTYAYINNDETKTSFKQFILLTAEILIWKLSKHR